MAVKVFIKRHIKDGKTEEAFALLNKLRSKAMDQPGYISGETLVNHFDTRSITVISTWQTIEEWISWQESDERAATEAQLDSILEEAAKFEIYDLGFRI
ncbi:MAG: antibiotic biosynthesis monooxygenase family protein [bacterium]